MRKLAALAAVALCLPGLAQARGLPPPPPPPPPAPAPPPPAPPPPPAECNQTISPSQSIAALVDALGPGQVGCLRQGSYDENVAIRKENLELRSAPGEIATLDGRLWISDSANDVTIRGLVIRGNVVPHENPTVIVNGDRARLIGNDISNGHTTICLVLGSVIGYGQAVGTLVERNRIHDCGVLPPENHHHGIFVENSLNGVIRDNWIYDNSDKGIVFFPDSDGNLVEHNVIDGNSTGVHFGGSLLQDPWHPTYPRDNLVRNNLITNSRRYNVEAYWEWSPPADVNNQVIGNCVFGGGIGNIQDGTPEWPAGFVATGNIEADPLYVNRSAKDFRLQPGSPCAGKGPR